MKKVLFIAYQIPPVSGAACQRHIRFLSNLDGCGWQPVVLTCRMSDYADYYHLDHSGTGSLDGSIAIHRARNFNPFEVFLKFRQMLKTVPSSDFHKSGESNSSPERRKILQSIKNFISDLFRLPDRQNGWFLFAVIKGFKLIRSEKIDVIYASGNPWTSFFIGISLSLLFRLPVVVDFRDPWVRNPYNEKKNKWIEWIQKKMEAFVVKKADAVIANTRNLKAAFIEDYGDIEHKFVHISNGYLKGLFQHLGKKEPGKRPIFTLAHVGTVYSHRSPGFLLNAILRLKKAGKISKDNFQLLFVGQVNRKETHQKEISNLGLSDMVRFIPPVPHEKALNYIVQSDVLLILQQGTELQIPGKLFEYIAVGKPVLAIADKGATRDIILEENLGLVANSDSLDSIEATLFKLIEAHEKKQLDQWGGKKALKKYDAQTLTIKLANLFDQCLKENRP